MRMSSGLRCARRISASSAEASAIPAARRSRRRQARRATANSHAENDVTARKCADPPVQQQQGFLNRVINIGRAAIARGIAADVGLGYRDQRNQRIGVAAARDLDQQGVATPCSGQRDHGEGSLRPTMAHIGQKPKNPVAIAIAPVPAIK